MKSNHVIIIRKYKGIGIDNKAQGYDLSTGEILERKVYNGRLCYLKGGLRIGYSTISSISNKCRIELVEEVLPF